MKILSLIVGMVEEQLKKNSVLDGKVIELVNEIDKLEMRLAEKAAYLTKFEEGSYNYNYYNREVLELKAKIEAKLRLIERMESI